MRQQIADVKYGISLLLADLHFHLAAVAEHNRTVQSKRNRRPLILFYTAVIMRFAQRDAVRFVQRHLLEIKARAVDMRSHNTDSACFHVIGTDADKIDILAAVVIIYLVALFQLFAKLKRLETVFFGLGCNVRASFAFRFCRVDKLFIFFRIREDFFHRLFVRYFVYVCSFVCKFAHNVFDPPLKIIWFYSFISAPAP